MAEVDLAPFLAMKEAGAAPREICKKAMDAGFGRANTIRILRSLFDLSSAEARRLHEDLDGPQTEEALFGYMKEHLGYCDCSSNDALIAFRDILRAARDKVDRVGEPGVFEASMARIRELIGPEGRTGVGEWFVYLLEGRGLLYHGFHVADLYITEQGRRILRAIERFDRPDDLDLATEARSADPGGDPAR